MHHHLGRAIADDEMQLGYGEPCIERHEHCAKPAAGELHLQRIGGVERQHDDAIAAGDFQLLAQMRGEPRDAGIECCISEAATAREINRGQLVRCPPGEMRNPIIVPNGHMILRFPFRELAPRYGLAACPKRGKAASRTFGHGQ